MTFLTEYPRHLQVLALSFSRFREREERELAERAEAEREAHRTKGGRR